MHAEIEQILGLAIKIEGDALADAILEPVNSEQFVGFDDLRELPEIGEWDEWLVFLSGKQKEFARATHEGAARLRGVSGSGKTCVLLHRAKHLVNEYDSNVLVATSTESMRAQLDRLLDQLCEPMVRGQIVTRTVVELSREVIGGKVSVIAEPDRETLMTDIVLGLQDWPEFRSSGLKGHDASALHTFIGDEASYIRTRLRRRDYRGYYDPQIFVRRGRGRGLTKDGRWVCLEAVRIWEAWLCKQQLWDDPAIVQFALELIENDRRDAKFRAQDNKAPGATHINGSAVLGTIPKFVSILVDEVQDLTQLEISLLGALQSGDGAKVGQKRDGLYLVGDSAQAIYKKGFSLRACGIELPGARSFFLKQNYRNTREILEAAFAVIETFPYIDFGEETSAPPASPEYALQHGARPGIVACASVEEEATFIADKIESLHLSAASGSAAEDGAEKKLPIGIIAANPDVRGAIIGELQRRQLEFGELLVDRVDKWTSTMLCDVESCKGHEFHTVFVAGVQDGAFPRPDAIEEDLPQEAARLYVAMTRACRLLFLTHSSSAGESVSPFLWLARSRCNEFRFHSGGIKAYDASPEVYAGQDRRRWENWLLRLRQRSGIENPDGGDPPSKKGAASGSPSKLSKDAILAKVQTGEMTAKEASELLAATPKRGQLYCKVSLKGAVSVYGLQRMPVTLYAGQWERLLAFEEEIRQSLAENASTLSRKNVANSS